MSLSVLRARSRRSRRTGVGKGFRGRRPEEPSRHDPRLAEGVLGPGLVDLRAADRLALPPAPLRPEQPGPAEGRDRELAVLSLELAKARPQDAEIHSPGPQGAGL